MSVIKSFSVGNGDMFYIEHNNKTLTIIDCNLNEEIRNSVLNEIMDVNRDKDFNRFISTHPDKDHITGLKLLDDKIGINNFYCVSNKIVSDNSEDFDKYCELREKENTCDISLGCIRCWLNDECGTRKSSGISFLWPDISNEYYVDELNKIECGKVDSPNNISPVIKYSLKNGVTVLWFGDMESDFLEKVKDEINFTEVDVIFAPHHGRKTGKIPKDILDKIQPKLVIIGEAESEYLDYYENYNTITQNSAKNIVFECRSGEVDIFTSEDFNHEYLQQKRSKHVWKTGESYRGTLDLD